MKEDNFVINFIDLVHWQQLIGKSETQFSLCCNEILNLHIKSMYSIFL